MDSEKKRRIENGADVNDFKLTEMEMRKMMEMLNKEDLVNLLLQAAVQYETVAQQVMTVASTNVNNRKLFVRGLAWETTTETLLAAFAEYGEIEEGAVITDRMTGRSRGFGFVTFAKSESAYRALREGTKMIDGRSASCNLAAAGPQSHPTASNVGYAGGGHAGGAHAVPTDPYGRADLSLRKLYCWGLSYDTTNETFREVFAQFGEIEEGSVAFERDTQKSRGFGFITFRSAEDAKKALVEPIKFIDGRKVSVKYALDGQKDKPGHLSHAQGQYLQQQQTAAMAAALTGAALQNPMAFSAYGVTPGAFPQTSLGAGLSAAGLNLTGTQAGVNHGATTAQQQLAATLAATGSAGTSNAAAAAAANLQMYGFGGIAPGGFGLPGGHTINPGTYFTG